MGQYYKPCNINKLEFMSSYTFNNGSKLMESAWINNWFVGNVMVRLCDETVLHSSKKIAAIPFAGTWANDRIVWAGDYMDPLTLLPDNYISTCGEDCFKDGDEDISDDSMTLYNLACNTFNELKDNDDAVDVIYSLKNVYFLNHDLKQYTIIPKKPSNDEWVINPVSLLLSSGNGRGGGDYGGNNEEVVGTWAGCAVSISRKIPSGYTLIEPNFSEE